MGVYKHYREEWEKDKLFKGWLCKAPEELILAGHGEAYCKWCRVTLRAQKHDLKVHCSRKVHQQRALTVNNKHQKKLTKTVLKGIVSNSQLDELVTHLNSHPGDSKETVNEFWEEFAHKLSPDGSQCSETVQKWNGFAEVNVSTSPTLEDPECLLELEEPIDQINDGERSISPVSVASHDQASIVIDETTKQSTIPPGRSTARPTARPRTRRRNVTRRHNARLEIPWIVELERRRIEVEERIADAAIMNAEAAKINADAALISAETARMMAQAHRQLLEFLKNKS